MAKSKQEPQRKFDERMIEDLEWQDALEVLHDPDFKERMKAYNAAARISKQKCESYKLEAGETLRVGPFLITGAERNGGGFAVPAWTSIVAGEIIRTSA